MKPKFCLNPLCVQNHNLVYWLNRFYTEHPRSKLGAKDFMKIQQACWKKVKGEMHIDID